MGDGGGLSESLISPSSLACSSTTSIWSGTGGADVTGCMAGEDAVEDTPPEGSSVP